MRSGIYLYNGVFTTSIGKQLENYKSFDRRKINLTICEINLTIHSLVLDTIFIIGLDINLNGNDAVRLVSGKILPVSRRLYKDLKDKTV